MEEWRGVIGYEHLYQVSNLGRVKRLMRIVKTKSARTIIFKEIFIKLKPNRRGYIRIHLSIGAIKFQVSVHRLVGLAFIQNPENKPHINHKNGVKYDNRSSNLEWCTSSENNLHAHRTGLCPSVRPKRPYMTGLKNKSSKKVQFLHTGEIMSVGQGADFVDLDRGHFIRMLKGEYKNWSGFVYL